MGFAKILIVDDEPDVEVLIRQKFRHELKTGSLSFVFAGDGQEALDLIGADPEIEIVLTDINMPRMDGLTLLSKLVALPDAPTTVVVSAYGDMANIRTAMNNGAFDFLTKPIEFEDLGATLEKTLSHVRQIKQLAKEREHALQMQTMFSQYFSPAIVKAMLADPNNFNSYAERREGTFLFTDVQGFLSFVENATADQVVELVNAYLEGVTELVFRHGGTVMKIVGDGVYAAFGAPDDDPAHADNAIACALEIDSFAEAFRQQREKAGLAMGLTRIGIHTGEAVIGRFGGEQFFDYAAYGAAVNQASRLEQANKTLGTRICVSAATVDRSTQFRGRPAGNLKVAGSELAMACYEPVTKAHLDDERLGQYNSAYEKLIAGEAGAKSAFAALIGQNSEDGLAAFHLSRILRGEEGVDVTL